MTSGITFPGGGTHRDDVVVRRATAGDAKRLTRLVRSSRAYEGPYAPMTAGYRVGPDYIEAHQVFVAAAVAGATTGPGDGTGPGAVTGVGVGTGAGAATGTGRVLGFYSLILSPPELDLMFVADDAQGLGIGRLLVGHLRGEARRAGLSRVRIVSHPPSEGFYRSVGAERVGTLAANPPAVMWDRPELVLPVV
ncbi:GNAT family N-acetyltransferase [Streptomyces sp. BE147]|uniref:GNAT family N-acetyltransferase n=1 Tax=Streptomyces sp. BE147 TaxID=3002524 RepID=UPI002E78862A|nr:GNAT family N-acetyltransferase [Streptomyces sp. BE147]MEE1740457.1 GNAT family N-acetyltransferase [Streptomyces sp. BE147]